MPSRFEDRFQTFAVPNFNREFGVTVRLSRGVDVTEEFTARRNDRTQRNIGGDLGIQAKVTLRYFILPVSEVVISGRQLEPQDGDQISEGSEVFEIQPPDDGTPSVELLAGGYEWGVYTRQVE